MPDPKVHVLPITRLREQVCRIVDVFCIKVVSPSQHHSVLHPKPVCFVPSLHTFGAHFLNMVVPISSTRPFFLLQSNFPTIPSHSKSRFHPPHTSMPLSPPTTLILTTMSTIVPLLLLLFPLSFLSSLPLATTTLHNNTQVQTATETFHQALNFSSFLFLPGFAASGWMIVLVVVTLSLICTVSLHFPSQLLLCFCTALHFLSHFVFHCSSCSLSSCFLPVVI